MTAARSAPPSARRCRTCGSLDCYVVDSRLRTLGRRGGDCGSVSELSRTVADREVLDATGEAGLEVVWRRLECVSCGWRWNTYELREADLLGVVARHRRRTPRRRRDVDRGARMTASTWTTRDGRRISVAEMTLDHVVNAARMMLRPVADAVLASYIPHVGRASTMRDVFEAAWPGAAAVFARALAEGDDDLRALVEGADLDGALF